MAAVNWQAIVEACDTALLDIATTQRPQNINYAGRALGLFTEDRAIRLREYALNQQKREAGNNDPVSFASYGGLI